MLSVMIVRYFSSSSAGACGRFLASLLGPAAAAFLRGVPGALATSARLGSTGFGALTLVVPVFALAAGRRSVSVSVGGFLAMTVSPAGWLPDLSEIRILSVLHDAGLLPIYRFAAPEEKPRLAGFLPEAA